jgi:DNA (cytosine-5)-methyltransferase 1
LENVKGLLTHDEGKTFQTIIRVLADLGYRVEWQVLNSKHYGVPQNRERVFIVGHLGRKRGRKIFPLGQSSRPAYEDERTTSREIRFKKFGGKATTRDGVADTLTASYGEESGEATKIIEDPSLKELTGNIHQGHRIYDSEGISRTLTASGRDVGKETGLYMVKPFFQANKERSWQKNRVREDDQTMFTLTSTDRHGVAIEEEHDKDLEVEHMRIRRLTPVECERLQGFPDNWTEVVSESQRYKTLGNAVTTNVITAVMTKLFSTFPDDFSISV